jgi:hypothetical protein
MRLVKNYTFLCAEEIQFGPTEGAAHARPSESDTSVWGQKKDATCRTSHFFVCLMCRDADYLFGR